MLKKQIRYNHKKISTTEVTVDGASPQFSHVMCSTTELCPFHHCKHDAAESFPHFQYFHKEKNTYKCYHQATAALRLNMCIQY